MGYDFAFQFVVVISGIHFTSALSPEATSENITDSIYHLVMAASFLVASRLVKAGKRAVIYLLGLIGIVGVVYSLMMGRGFNPITIVVIAIFIWQMLNLSKNGELQ